MCTLTVPLQGMGSNMVLAWAGFAALVDCKGATVQVEGVYCLWPRWLGRGVRA